MYLESKMPELTCLLNSPVRARGPTEDSDSGNPEDTSNNHRQNGRDPARRHLRRDEEESSIIDTEDGENT